MSGPRRPGREIRVWDAVVRLSHWVLVGSVALSVLGLVAWFGVHRPAGYVALAVALVRIVWGFVGSAPARFASFVRGPRATWRYARAAMSGTAARHLGHNPLGGWMTLALLVCVIGLGASGWLYTTDAFWGDETVESTHRALAWTLLGLVLSHVVGVAFTSWQHRENLVAAMVDGKKA